MKQWLNTPVTYGCMIRIFLIDLQPGRYNVWTGGDIDKPKSVIVQIDKGIVSELDLNWKN